MEIATSKKPKQQNYMTSFVIFDTQFKNSDRFVESINDPNSL